MSEYGSISSSSIEIPSTPKANDQQKQISSTVLQVLSVLLLTFVLFFVFLYHNLSTDSSLVHSTINVTKHLPTLHPTVSKIDTEEPPSNFPTFNVPTTFSTSKPSKLSSTTSTSNPSQTPTHKPSNQPSQNQPSQDQPSQDQPSHKPSNQPSHKPTDDDDHSTHKPTTSSTSLPDSPFTSSSSQPSHATHSPTVLTTDSTKNPTHKPTHKPTLKPTHKPSHKPTHEPSESPTSSSNPSQKPTHKPTHSPSQSPDSTEEPSLKPTHKPTYKPTHKPTYKPTHKPTHSPTHSPASDDQDDDDDGDDDDSVSAVGSPNFIFILADDLGWNSIGYEDYDLSFASPTLTSLAQQGIIFSNYYTQEVCAPARAALLTGKYPVTIGMQFNDISESSPWGLNLSQTLFPELLQDAGYTTYAIGKWNMGHFSPIFLPTARGFDYYLGYLTAENYYWSKINPTFTDFIDFTYADKDCYYGYNGSDLHDYSTTLFKDKAINVIENHDYSSSPLFMYFASQAVHSPFSDYHHHYHSGIPPSYISSSTWEKIHSTVVGRKRREYAISLVLLDEAVKKMVEALESVGQMNNTYIIFTSDNGGCYRQGGKNGPLRGTKGSLFEGGTKVDAFIYSPVLIPSAYQGTVYSGLMHVTDWFPTILDLADISYTPSISAYELDGFSQASAMFEGADANSRSYLLYNYYYDVNAAHFGKNGPFGLRDTQYKLLHTYSDNHYSQWYDYDERESDDAILSSGTCSQSSAITGTLTNFLFDLDSDPYETDNLFANSSYSEILNKFYTELSTLRSSAVLDMWTNFNSKEAQVTWREQENYIGPWVDSEDINVVTGRSYPARCVSSSLLSP